MKVSLNIADVMVDWRLLNLFYQTHEKTARWKIIIKRSGRHQFNIISLSASFEFLRPGRNKRRGKRLEIDVYESVGLSDFGFNFD